MSNAKKPPVWQQLTTIVPLLFDKKTPSAAKWAAGLSVLYLLIPIDVIPDILIPLGYVDDLTILYLTIRYIWNKLYPTAQNETKIRKSDVIDV